MSENHSTGDLSLFERVRGLIAEGLSVPEGDISEESSFADDLGADSLDVVELVMAFESEFNVEIPDKEAEAMTKVGDVIKHLKDKLV